MTASKHLTPLWGIEDWTLTRWNLKLQLVASSGQGRPPPFFSQSWRDEGFMSMMLVKSRSIFSTCCCQWIQLCCGVERQSWRDLAVCIEGNSKGNVWLRRFRMHKYPFFNGPHKFYPCVPSSTYTCTMSHCSQSYCTCWAENESVPECSILIHFLSLDPLGLSISIMV